MTTEATTFPSMAPSELPSTPQLPPTPTPPPPPSTYTYAPYEIEEEDTGKSNHTLYIVGGVIALILLTVVSCGAEAAQIEKEEEQARINNHNAVVVGQVEQPQHLRHSITQAFTNVGKKPFFSEALCESA